MTIPAVPGPQVGGPPAVAPPVRAGGAKNFGEHEIKDEEDPATFIENFVKKESGKEFKEVFVELKGGFAKEGSSTKLIAYRNPPGPDCYALEREWKVTFKDAAGVANQEAVFKKTIYTSVQVPTESDGPHDQKQYMAGIAASMYADIVESMVKSSADVHDAMYDKIKDHMDKIRKDRFVSLVMLEGKHEVDVNPSSSKGVKKLYNEDIVITQVRLDIRRGDEKKKDSKEYADSAHPLIDLKAEKVNKAAGTKIQYREKLKSKKYTLVAGDSASPQIKEMAKIQQNEAIKQEIIAEADVDVVLNKHRVNKNTFRSVIEGSQRELDTKWFDRLRMLENPEFFDSLTFRFAGQRAISPRVKENLSPGPHGHLFTKIATISDQLNKGELQYTQVEREDLDAVKKTVDRLFNVEMTQNYESQMENFKILKKLADPGKRAILEQEENVLKRKFNALKQASILLFSRAPTSPLRVGPALDSSSSDSSSSEAVNLFDDL